MRCLADSLGIILRRSLFVNTFFTNSFSLFAVPRGSRIDSVNRCGFFFYRHFSPTEWIRSAAAVKSWVSGPSFFSMGSGMLGGSRGCQVL